MDIVYIRGLQVAAVIGIYDWERRARQALSIDLEMGCDIAAAATSEDIDTTLNYKSVSQRLLRFVGDSEFQLVETLAQQLAELVMREFPVAGLRLRLSKPGAVGEAADVGVLIERGVALR